MGESETGLDENVAGALSYLLGALTGILFVAIERDNEFVRFHAAQSIVVFGGLLLVSVGVSVLSTVLTTGALGGGAGALVFGLLSLFLSLLWFGVFLAGFVLWLYLMVRAYSGETPRVPVAAGIADRLV
ncbi:membrane protein [Halobacterium sp. DL1]|nr:membrane protein [Halobacterium sp. DL1]